jgi:hypothetical protein
VLDCSVAFGEVHVTERTKTRVAGSFLVDATCTGLLRTDPASMSGTPDVPIRDFTQP